MNPNGKNQPASSYDSHETIICSICKIERPGHQVFTNKSCHHSYCYICISDRSMDSSTRFCLIPTCPKTTDLYLEKELFQKQICSICKEPSPRYQVFLNKLCHHTYCYTCISNKFIDANSPSCLVNECFNAVDLDATTKFSKYCKDHIDSRLNKGSESRKQEDKVNKNKAARQSEFDVFCSKCAKEASSSKVYIAPKCGHRLCGDCTRKLTSINCPASGCSKHLNEDEVMKFNISLLEEGQNPQNSHIKLLQPQEEKKELKGGVDGKNKSKEDIKRTEGLCSVCQQENPTGQMFTNSLCNHSFCYACIVEEFNIGSPLFCLAPTCSKTMEFAKLKMFYEAKKAVKCPLCDPLKNGGCQCAAKKSNNEKQITNIQQPMKHPEGLNLQKPASTTIKHDPLSSKNKPLEPNLAVAKPTVSIKSKSDPLQAIVDNVNEQPKKPKEEDKLPDKSGKPHNPGSDIGDEIICSYCTDYIYKCVTAWPCLHNFCSACFHDFSKKFNKCPLCDRAIQGVNRNAVISNITEKYLDSHPEKRRLRAEYDDMDKKDRAIQDILDGKQALGPKGVI